MTPNSEGIIFNLQPKNARSILNWLSDNQYVLHHTYSCVQKEPLANKLPKLGVGSTWYDIVLIMPLFCAFCDLFLGMKLMCSTKSPKIHLLSSLIDLLLTSKRTRRCFYFSWLEFHVRIQAVTEDEIAFILIFPISILLGVETPSSLQLCNLLC
jgi:hypothetical protein